MAQTGKERSLTVIITKKIADVMQDNYPVTYQGRKEFTFNGHVYAEISLFQMVSMSQADFSNRVTAFKLYIESKEIGMSFSTDLINGTDAYRDNAVSCPIQTIE